MMIIEIEMLNPFENEFMELTGVLKCCGDYLLFKAFRDLFD
jgi:hypothetical protein